MRASSVLIMALALFVGLAVAAGAKSAGLFDRKAPPASAAPAPTKVLVANVTLFEDVTTTSDAVRVRDLQPDEEAKFEQRFGKGWKERLMPASPSSVHLRTMKQTLSADTVLLREHFADPGLPERLTAQLEPNTRAVNVSVPKDKGGGGVLRVGEYVDVLLTTKVSSGGREELRTAPIARACKVVMKRNVQWTIMASNPDTKPMSYTLQANAYRAALIEFAQTFGQMTLQPVPPPAKNSNGFSDPSSREYANEDQRVDDVLRGVRTIGSEDLARIFQVTPPPARAAAPAPLRVQHLSGVAVAGETVLPGVAAPASAPAAAVRPTAGTSDTAADGVEQAGYTFRLPSATGDAGCKSCEEKKRKREEDAKYQTVRPN